MEDTNKGALRVTPCCGAVERTDASAASAWAQLHQGICPDCGQPFVGWLKEYGWRNRLGWHWDDRDADAEWRRSEQR